MFVCICVYVSASYFLKFAVLTLKDTGKLAPVSCVLRPGETDHTITVHHYPDDPPFHIIVISRFLLITILLSGPFLDTVQKSISSV